MNRIGTFRRGAVGALVVGLLSLVAAPTTASAQSALESTLLTLTNTARAVAGMPAVTLDGTLSSIARDWANSMAAAGGISHNPDVKAQLSAAGVGWRKTGENVGMGPTLTSIHEALLASPGHFRNIVDPDFDRVGLAVVATGNTLWIVQNFVMSRSVATAPAPAAAADPGPGVTAVPATAPPTTKAPKPTTTQVPETTTTTTSTLPPAPSTTVAPLPPADGLPLRLTLMVQQLRALPSRP
ncbi:MAG TPA: CAP domain-containing protein [Acidimicrobiales bacterium]